MSQEQPYSILAFYHFTTISNPQEEVRVHKSFFKDRSITSRVYISENGINGQLSAANKDAQEYMAWLRSRPEFSGVVFKVDPHHEHVFPRTTVKYRKQLVAFDVDVDLSERGEHVSPAKWKELLETPDHPILLDVRNEYEWEVGHFKGAERPPCETFRDFKKYTEDLKQKVDPKTTPVMMYCTGGIRCELYSALLKEGGFDKIYQLEGGVINYGHKEGSQHWLGKLFVFDDRLAVPISDEEAPIVGKCHHCKTSNDSYYNCANMDCNHLFLCCQECLEKYVGCCKEACSQSPRLRPYHHQSPHKPFRKWYKYSSEKPSTKVEKA